MLDATKSFWGAKIRLFFTLVSVEQNCDRWQRTTQFIETSARGEKSSLVTVIINRFTRLPIYWFTNVHSGGFCDLDKAKTFPKNTFSSLHMQVLSGDVKFKIFFHMHRTENNFIEVYCVVELVSRWLKYVNLTLDFIRSSSKSRCQSTHKTIPV